MSIDAIQAVSSEFLINNGSDLLQAESKPNIGFMDIVRTEVGELNTNLVESSQLLEKMAMGEKVSTHEIMLAMSEAKMSVKMAVEVRNKLLDAYQEVMKMQL